MAEPPTYAVRHTPVNDQGTSFQAAVQENGLCQAQPALNLAEIPTARKLGDAQLQGVVVSWPLAAASRVVEKWPVREIGLVTQIGLLCLGAAECYCLTLGVAQQCSVQT